MARSSDLMACFLKRRAEMRPRLAWAAGTAGEHEAWRRRFAPRLRRLVGRMPDPAPPGVEWAEVHETEAIIRRKVYIRSERDYWVPAFVFIPRTLARPAPAVVCLHGHSGVYPYIREGDERQRRFCREHALDFAPFFAERGYVAVAPIQRGWDETAASVDPSANGCYRVALSAFLAGMTPIGLRCWDASRVLDAVADLECVDPSRIGVAGLSGGGMTALFWAALEPRVRLAMVGGYYCTFADSIYAIHHCICNCVPGMLEWGEMREIAALVAPRPLLVISGTKDPIFPIAATRRAYAELAAVYRLLGARGNLEKDFFDGPHAWSNRKTPAFLRRHFGPPAGPKGAR